MELGIAVTQFTTHRPLDVAPFLLRRGLLSSLSSSSLYGLNDRSHKRHAKRVHPKDIIVATNLGARVGLANSLTFQLLANSSNFVGQAIFKFRQRLTWFSVSHL